MYLIHKKNCRVCKSTTLTKVIDLGEQYLQGSFIKPGKDEPPKIRFPTSLVFCNPALNENSCGLLQMEYTVLPEILYKNYWYRSGINKTMREHLKGITEEAALLVKKQKALVLDIGCNDGTLLNFYPKDFQKYGIDPSNIAAEAGSDINIIVDFFPSDKLIKVLNGQKFDVVTSIAMFYDLEDPIIFAKSIKEILSTEGIWIFEMSYMPTMLEMLSYDTICHEHLEYYSLSVIEYILNKAGMRLFNVSLNSINGGSFRCYATSSDSSIYDSKEFKQNIENLHYKERKLELNTEKSYKHFQKSVDAHKLEMKKLLSKLKQEGKKIHVYGASTKGNTILQWCEIDNKIIDVAAERNPDKYGARTIGTNIPIVSEAESRAMNPDYYLVLPWHFKEEILERERETLNKGVGLIFPLPVVEVIKKQSIRL